MPIIAEFVVDGSEFLLAQTLETVDDVTVEIVRVVAHESDRVTPYIRVSGTNLEAFDRVLRFDPSVEEERMFQGDGGNERLYYVEWKTHVSGIQYAITTAGATILEAISSDGSWTLTMLFPTPESLSDFHEYSTSRGLSYDLARIYQSPQRSNRARYGVTEKQHEVLLTAYTEGYFSIPRQISQRELGQKFTVSRNAISARLRRGIQNLIKHTLVHGSPSTPIDDGDPFDRL